MGREVAVLISAVLVSFCALAATRAHADDPQPADDTAELRREASEHFRRGVELYAESDYEGALIEFERANQILPSYPVLYNIAQTRFQLRRYVGAHAALERYIELGGDDLSPERRVEVDALLRTLRSRIGELLIEVNVPDAEVRLDGVEIELSPGVAIPVDVGVHRVQVRAPGHEAAEETTTVAGGDRSTVRIELHPIVVVVAGDEGPPVNPYLVSGVTTGVFAALAVAAGCVTGVMALEQRDRVESLQRQIPADRAAVDGARAQAADFALATDVLIGGGIALGVASLVILLVDPGTSPTTETVRLDANGVSVSF